MRALIVLAHPAPLISAAALACTAIEARTPAGWDVDPDDLPNRGRRPDAGRHDVLEEPIVTRPLRAR